MDNVKKGDIIKGKVTGIEPYGIFVQFEDDYNGLVHISEISEEFVRDIHNFVEIDEMIYCQVIEVGEEKKLKLSIKDINYKSTPINSDVEETRLGFLPLKEQIDKWIEEKIKLYKE